VNYSYRKKVVNYRLVIIEKKPTKSFHLSVISHYESHELAILPYYYATKR